MEGGYSDFSHSRAGDGNGDVRVIDLHFLAKHGMRG